MFYLSFLIEEDVRGGWCIGYIKVRHFHVLLTVLFEGSAQSCEYRFHTEKAFSCFAYNFLSDSTHAPIKGYA